MPSVFSLIIAGDLPGHFVWRDDLCVVFMPINPTHDGHALVVPIEEVDSWTDLPEDTAAHLMRIAQKVAKAQEKAFDTARVGLMIAGFEVPHVHLHVVPMNSMRELDFSNAATDVNDEELAKHATRLNAILTQAGESTGVSLTD